VTGARELIDWHAHWFLPEHVDPASAAAMRARGLSWGDVGPRISSWAWAESRAGEA
jgi:hypothetical protein